MRKSMPKVCLSSIILLLSFGLFQTAKAQNASDVLRYSLQYPSYDPLTIVMPGVAYASGFGAYQENPAVMALFDNSFFSAGLSDRYVTEESIYLGNASTFDVNTLGISHAGLVYKVPTSRGSLVVGGGYSLTSGFNRAISGFGFNAVTTITDFYASLPITAALNEAAYSAFAIIDPVGPDDSKSILRFADNDFLGITQSFEIVETGSMGEYSAFLATELFKNLMVGVSIGAIVGDYEYEQTFLEIDKRNLYSGANVDIDNDGDFDTDVNRILSESTVKETFTGFSARLGLVYQISPHFNFGASYQFKNVLYVERKPDVFISTTFDNGVEFIGELSFVNNYKVIRPARLNLGLAATDLNGFTLSAMVERVDYSSASIEFENLDMTDIERSINRTIENEFQSVLNLRFGLEYAVTPRFTPRIGYGYYPAPAEDKNSDRQFLSGGFTVQVSENTTLNVGAQYATWEDKTILYTTPFGNEVVEEQVNRWNIMAGLTFYF